MFLRRIMGRKGGPAAKRSVLARLGTVSLVLLVAMGIVGTGYAFWSDTIAISGTVNTGTYSATLSEGIGDPAENVTASISENTFIINLLEVGADSVYYYRNFGVTSTGTVPIKVQSIFVNSPPNVAVLVTGIAAGDVIDPGETITGTVEMYTSAGGNYQVQVTIETVRWNQ